MAHGLNCVPVCALFDWACTRTEAEVLEKEDVEVGVLWSRSSRDMLWGCTQVEGFCL